MPLNEGPQVLSGMGNVWGIEKRAQLSVTEVNQ